MPINTFLRTFAPLAAFLFTCFASQAGPVDTKYLSNVPQYVQYESAPGAFRLAAGGVAASIIVSGEDWQGVVRAAGDLGQDIGRVTGTAAQVVKADTPRRGSIIVGTIGKSPLIDGLVKAGRLNVDGVRGQWESFVIETVDGSLVVAGSDKRGTIYGIYDISEKIGVSPWYWWADVAPRKSASLYVREGRNVQPSPKVKYRGIFINDERRILVSIDWSKAKAGCNEATVTLKGGGKTVNVAVKAVKGDAPKAKGKYFGNLSGAEFAIPAYMFSRNLTGEGQSWTLLPGLGRGEGCMGASDVCKQSADKGRADKPTLEYQVLLPDTNTVTLCIGILPVQDVRPERGLRLAVQIDGQKPMVLDARQGFKDEFQEYTKENLAMSPNLKPLPEVEKNILLTGYGQLRRNEVFDNMQWLTARLPVAGGGLHTVKIIMVDPEVVLERIVVNPDNARPSYFGAPEICHNN